MTLPPLPPPDPMRRVVRLALFDGWSVAIVAGLGGLLSAALADLIGTLVGIVITSAGIIELQGVDLLRRSDPRGMTRLITSQLMIMGSLLAYCAFQLAHPQIAALRAQVGPLVEQQIADAGLDLNETLTQLYRTLYYAVALTTTLYQGGMTLYYLRRRTTAAQAFALPPVLPGR